MLQIRIYAAKTNKYAVSEGGDSLEITERPRGGLSVILADGQGSGKSARTNSKLVVSKAAALIADGARDGAVARAVHDMLYALRDGRVSSTLTIVSADLDTRSVVICQNGGPPVFLLKDGVVQILEHSAHSIGVHKGMKPDTYEVPLEEGILIVGMTDGIYAAGKSRSRPWRENEISELIASSAQSPEVLATHFLEEAVAKDASRPTDDMSVFVLHVREYYNDIPMRTMAATMPC